MPCSGRSGRLESMTSQKLGFQDFWRIANSVFNKGKSARPPLFNGPEVLSSASDKNVFLKTFLRTLILGLSLPLFVSITNLNMHNISITLKIVKKSHN